jgi:hypothetical protein
MVKYIKTKDGKIIVFPGTMMHSDFKHFEPTSAGFVEFYIINDEVRCRCYGESISLGLKCDTIKDSFIANNTIIETFF